jgi:ABC-type multidrug transport system ATPase subunit
MRSLFLYYYATSATGTLSANGKPIDAKSFRKETGYVMQSDALFPMLTVRETIRYAAYLRVPGKTVEEKNAIADSVVSLLRLDKAADTIVGDENSRGLSGGEKRRVSIGVDIVHFPSVIFLDEPTSGLDSTTALSVIDSLKQLAVQQNCTVVMTIHQPSTRLFNLLDRVLFLSAGRVTYYGAVDGLHKYIGEVYKQADLGTYYILRTVLPPSLP